MKIARLVATNENFWRGRRVLVTGHTGFKGAWLSLWLQALGAELSGFSSGRGTTPSLYEQARVGEGMRAERGDIRDAAAFRAALAASGAEVVLHLAAQPMVRRSLREPALTYEVNVMGTVNVLEAVRAAGGQVRAVLVVTSGFDVHDQLGGGDPYSSSKAAAELVVAAYRRSYFTGAEGARLASARAGNVIGGGDRGEDRLLADALRAVESGEELLLRNPDAVRPWQHVLNPLAGYLLLAQALCEEGESAPAAAWDFGPPASDVRSVGWVVERLAELWDGRLRWRADERASPPEARHLALDASAAQERLGWRPAWNLEEALARVVEWHRREQRGEDMREHTLAQIAAYSAA